MKKVLNVTYASSLTNLCEINSSFDAGVLRICYTGTNRNGSSISKKAIEKSLKTIYNCPVVCNYDRETDTLGGHDVEVVRDDEGGLRIVNMTTPIGIVTESSKTWYEQHEEEDGTIHDYLCAEVLLWKRQEAYQKIKKDGITAQSMEITIKDGKTIDGVYHIYDFEFTAFALIGVEPCFEGAALELFSKQDFKQQLSEMMQDLKENFREVNTSSEVDDIQKQNYSMEGGNEVLEEKNNLIAEYGIDIETLDFSIEDFTIEELRDKFEAMKAASNNDANDNPTEEPLDNKFALTSNIVDEIRRVLGEVKVEREWGECTRYWYVDCDFESNEVYCWDSNDGLLYGFTYEINGDSVAIDFACKKRKKYVIADFDEGEQPSPFAPVFEALEQKLSDNADLEAKYQAASNTITSMEAELDELRRFKLDTDVAISKVKTDEIFARFEDLVGVEAFENLRESCSEYDLETLEEKCYAIRGRNGVPAKFSADNKVPKLKVDKTETPKEPYGGIFAKYGVNSNQ